MVRLPRSLMGVAKQAADEKDGRPVLACVSVSGSLAAAADGFALLRKQLAERVDGTLLIPAKDLMPALKDLSRKGDEHLVVERPGENGDYVLKTRKATRLAGRVGGAFPDVDMVIKRTRQHRPIQYLMYDAKRMKRLMEAMIDAMGCNPADDHACVVRQTVRKDPNVAIDVEGFDGDGLFVEGLLMPCVGSDAWPKRREATAPAREEPVAV